VPDTLLLQWTFEPADFFEEKMTLQAQGYEFTVDLGHAECRISVTRASTDCWLQQRTEAHQLLDACFLSGQVLSHRGYKLSDLNATRIDEKGTEHKYAFPQTGHYRYASQRPADTVTTDAATGAVIRDTKRERIDTRNALAQQAATHAADAVLNSMLRSYAAAVNDPQNELIHLYEVREALSAHFGGEKSAKQVLDISNTKWSALGKLSNDEPLIQGRHRGKHPGSLRAATAKELEEARAIVRELIEAYVRAI
jgi:hypothetical protein